MSFPSCQQDPEHSLSFFFIRHVFILRRVLPSWGRAHFFKRCTVQKYWRSIDNKDTTDFLFLFFNNTALFNGVVQNLNFNLHSTLFHHSIRPSMSWKKIKKKSRLLDSGLLTRYFNLTFNWPVCLQAATDRCGTPPGARTNPCFYPRSETQTIQNKINPMLTINQR